MSEEVLSADMSTPSRPAVTPQAVVGVSICLMGIALTLDNFGIYELRSFAELWPIVPISIGVLTLMYGETRQDWVKGTLWLALGIFFIFRHPADSRGLAARPDRPGRLSGVAVAHRAAAGAQVADGSAARNRRPLRRRRRLSGAAPYGAVNPLGGGRPAGRAERARRRGHRASPAAGRAVRPAADSGGLPSGRVRRGRLGWDGIAGMASAGAGAAAGLAGGRIASANAYRGRKRSRLGLQRPTGVPRRRRRLDASRSAPRTRATAPSTRLAPSDRIPSTGRGQRPTLFAMMSGVRRQVTGGFAGAEATAIMGGVELDLRYSAMDGDEVIIDTFALWGGIEIWVPTHWEIVSQGLPLMGAFEDKTHVTTHGGNRQPRLIVRGVAIMGGVEIKN